ncbi:MULTISPECIES: pyridoxamine 5'-phosphate oxidase family protein [Ramlibacter]|jgi:general stress protein 26|uniref:General stress protein n=1 Tax=Ramlibacter pinisoli TaxID=2682844 RepID=A0A6N8ISL0_9BURK|nr:MULTISPECIES: pyridoxamine 5'-phosphate oxidase family protein [Ramlibacter]MBA2964110.1 pyridoxamine 5'-phosphate oxidase family protein [Ramlibacter sp. CGMCC 1.13660]MVQ29076.1 general stress protein [Ramlibacter pinisoli]
MSKEKSAHDRLWDMIKDIRFGMLTHRHPEGGLHAHPLTTQNKELGPKGILYFFVSRKTELGQRLRADGNVGLSYGDPNKDVWVSISGTARISEDRDAIERLFNPMAKAWFPGGATDPDLELVEVHIDHAEYWDVKESKPTQLFKMAAAAVSGKKPQLGEHREVAV